MYLESLRSRSVRVLYRLAFGLVAFAAVHSPVHAAPLKVALILPGRVNDPGYFNAGYQALLAVKQKFGAQTVYQEQLKPADAEQVLRALGEDSENYVIVMGGGTYDDSIRDVSADYPNLKFIIVSGNFTQLPNIVSVRTGNAGVPYLAGVLMALMSQTGKIGLIGGRATPPAVADHVAVIAGARAERPDIEIFDSYTETYDDPAMGKEAALAQIDRGVDIVFANANTTSFGVFQAARERGILAIGAATDQNSFAPETILSSAVYGMDKALIYLLEQDRGPGWKNKVYTMDMSMVDLAPFHALGSRVSPQVRQRLAQVRRQLLENEIQVPTQPRKN